MGLIAVMRKVDGAKVLVGTEAIIAVYPVESESKLSTILAGSEKLVVRESLEDIQRMGNAAR